MLRIHALNEKRRPVSPRAIRSIGREVTQCVAVSALFMWLLPIQTAAAQSQGTVAPPVATRESLDHLNAKANTPDRAVTGWTGAPPTGTLVWTFLGPQPITNEYWSGNANASGRATSIAVDPTNGNTAYAATAGGGVWKTTDGGVTWTAL